MNIWIINHYASTMYFDKGWRHYHFAKYLKKQGHRPTVFCANSIHGQEDVYFKQGPLFHEKMEEEIQVPFVFVKACPYRDNGATRIRNMIQFYQNVKIAAKLYAKRRGRPDIILASSVHPLTLVAGIQLARHFHIKCICEVRDLWPESIVEYSGKWKKESLLIQLLYQGEKWIYQNADALIFTMEGGKQYIRDKGWDTESGGKINLDKVYHVNNGLDLADFDAKSCTYICEDEDLQNPDIFKVVYAGSIRRANYLGMLLDSAKLVKNPKIKFLIWGDGDETDTLKARVKAERISNVVFKGKVGKEYIPYIIKHADLNLIHWETSPLLKYGVSYNKLFEYLGAGKPIFSTVRPGYSLLARYGCGREAGCFQPEAIAQGIMDMCDLSQEKKEEFSIQARKAAAEYDFEKLGGRLLYIIGQTARG